MDAHSIVLTMRLARELIRVQRPDEFLLDFVVNIRQAYDDVNESCLLVVGPVVMLEHFLSISTLVIMPQEGTSGLAKQCTVNAFDPSLSSEMK
jgi:hypothetical protein